MEITIALIIMDIVIMIQKNIKMVIVVKIISMSIKSTNIHLKSLNILMKIIATIMNMIMENVTEDMIISTVISRALNQLKKMLIEKKKKLTKKN